MILKELLEKDRSYRGYDETIKLTKEELLDMVDCTRLCPSSINIQPLKYYLAWEKETVDKIQQTTLWAKGLPKMKLPHDGMCPTAFIVICQDTGIDESLQRFQRDVGIVAHTILLRAVEMGYGGCMIGNFRAGDLKESLSLPEYLAPMLVVALGKPKETIVIKEVEKGEDIGYYRDDQDIHYVPKRKLEDIVLFGE